MAASRGPEQRIEKLHAIRRQFGVDFDLLSPKLRVRVTHERGARFVLGQGCAPSSEWLPWIARGGAISIGTRVGEGDRYEIRKLIGRGAMAEVFQARDRRLNNRLVALKVLSPAVTDHAFSEKMRALFIEEAQALSRVKDDNVVAVLDSGTTADGTPYMVMECLNGRDLAGLLKEEKQLSVERTVDIMVAVCAGVHACHLAGIIHRDLKPANIFLDQTSKGEHPKVLDFSVAKVPTSRDETRTDLIVGTANYMSPEQALGRPANELSDQYSIGALTYRCLTGNPPKGLQSHSRELRPDIPEALEVVLLRAMDPLPGNRYPSVYTFGRELLPFASSVSRLRWHSYYETPPVPIPVRIEMPNGSAPIVQEDPAAITKIAPFDFGIHERTTNTVARSQVAESTASELTNTLQDNGPPTLSSLNETLSERSERPSERGMSAAPASPVIYQPTTPPPRRHRMFVVPIGALLLGIVALWYGTSGRPPSVAPALSGWTKSKSAPDGQSAAQEPSAPTILRAVRELPPLATPSHDAPGAEPPSGGLPQLISNPVLPGNANETPRSRSRPSREKPRPNGRRAGLFEDAGVNTGGSTTDRSPLKYPAVGRASKSRYPAVE